MAFTPEHPRIPAATGDISVTLVDHDGSETDQVLYEVQVLQADGSLFSLCSGNLVPHLTSQQITAMQAFMADMRALAQGLLP
jgi:hypothetical protein